MDKGKTRLLILVGIFAVCTVTITIILWPFITDLSNPEYREAFSLWVQGLGIWGVLILFGMQVLQIIVAIIPGGPMEIIAGAAYGAWAGCGLIIAGCVFASTLIFSVVRKFGLSLLRRFFGEKDLNTWSFLKDSRKVSRLVFLLFLIPGTPKDLLTWLFPITNISLLQFVVLATLGRVPAVLIAAIMGDSMIQGNWILSLAIFLVIALAGFLGMWFRDKITQSPDSLPHNQQ